MSNTQRTVRIFISSPGDVFKERENARRVIEGLQKRYPDVTLQSVLWEDLALPATASFQESIDLILNKRPIDIAVFILWSRLGSPLNSRVLRSDGTEYRSGTEREFDIMLSAFEQSGKQRPVMLAYVRDDVDGFEKNLSEDRAEEMIAQRKLAKSFIREHFYDAQGRNARAYQTYREPVDFVDRFRAHLQQSLDDMLGMEATPSWHDAPYRGLDVFDVQHAEIFRGRDEETCDLMVRLRDQRRVGCAFAVIVGASGAGKSSLARAGVAATLSRHSGEDGVKVWRTEFFLPAGGTGNLLSRLARSLFNGLPELRTSDTALDDVALLLSRDPSLAVRLSIAPAFSLAAEQAQGVVRLLLVIDQMEELWTDRRITKEDRELFLSVVEALAASGHIAVLGTLRSDFYSHAQQHPEFLRLKGERGHFDLLPPNAAALQRLITEPARLAGVRFERQQETSISLDELILQDSAKDPSALPLLQYALSELYQKRDPRNRLLTFAAYQSMGGVEGALGKRAEEVYQDSKLSDEARDTIDEILPLLITIDTAGEQAPVRLRAPLSLLTQTPARAALTEVLISARFLTSDRHGDEAIATLTHEALLRCWGRIATWITSNREHLRLRARVEQSQHRWASQGQHVSLLLPSGLPLEEAQVLLMEARPLLLAETAEYIERSLTYRHAESRRQTFIRTTALIASLATALIAIIAALWIKQEQQATNLANLALENSKKEETKAKNTALAEAKNARTAAEQAKENEQVAKRSTQRAEAELTRADWEAYARQIELSYREWQAERLQNAKNLHERCRWDLQNWEHRFLNKLISESHETLHGHSGPVTALALNPGGKLLASGATNGELHIWNLQTNQLAHQLERDQKDPVIQIVWHQSETLILLTNNYMEFWRYETATNHYELLAEIQGEWDSVQASGDTLSALASTQHRDSSIQVFSIRDIVESFERLIAAHYAAGGHHPSQDQAATELMRKLKDDWARKRVRDKDHYNKFVELLRTQFAREPEAADSYQHLFEIGTSIPEPIGAISIPKDLTFAKMGSHDSVPIIAGVTKAGLLSLYKFKIDSAKLIDQPLQGDLATDKDCSITISSGLLIVADTLSRIRIWEIETGEMLVANSSVATSTDGWPIPIQSISVDSSASKILLGLESGTIIEIDGGVAEKKLSRFNILRRVGHKGSVNSITHVPGSKSVSVSGGSDGTVRIWGRSGKAAETIDLNNYLDLQHFCLSDIDNNAVIFSTSKDNISSLSLMNLSDGTRKSFGKLTGNVCGIICYRSNQVAKVRVLTGDGTVFEARENQSPDVICKLDATDPAEIGFSAGFSIDATEVAISVESPDHTGFKVYLYNANTGHQIMALPLPSRTPRLERHFRLIYHRDLIIGANGARVFVWKRAQPTEVMELSRHASYVSALAVDRQREIIATGDIDGNLRLSSASTGKEIARLRSHSIRINSLCFTPDGKRLASATGNSPSEPGEIQLWSTLQGMPVMQLQDSIGTRQMEFDSTGTNLVTLDLINNITIRRCSKSGSARAVDAHEGVVTSIGLCSDNRTLFTAGSDNKVAFWRPDSNRPSATWLNSCPITIAKNIPESHMIAIADAEGGLSLVDSITGSKHFSISAHSECICGLAVSPDGATLATTCTDRTARLWNLKDQSRSAILLGHQDAVLCAEWIGRTGLIALGSGDGLVSVWNAQERGHIQSISPDGGQILALAATSDGNHIGVADASGNISIWRVGDWVSVAKFRAHSGPARSICFSANSDILISGGADGLVKFWDWRAGAFIGSQPISTSAISSLQHMQASNSIGCGTVDRAFYIFEIPSSVAANPKPGNAALSMRGFNGNSTSGYVVPLPLESTERRSVLDDESSANFADTPFSDALQFLSIQHEFPIHYCGADPQGAVTLRLSGSLRTVLGALRRSGLHYHILDDSICVTNGPVFRHYPVKSVSESFLWVDGVDEASPILHWHTKLRSRRDLPLMTERFGKLFEQLGREYGIPIHIDQSILKLDSIEEFDEDVWRGLGLNMTGHAAIFCALRSAAAKADLIQQVKVLRNPKLAKPPQLMPVIRLSEDGVHVKLE